MWKAFTPISKQRRCEGLFLGFEINSQFWYFLGSQDFGWHLSGFVHNWKYIISVLTKGIFRGILLTHGIFIQFWIMALFAPPQIFYIRVNNCTNPTMHGFLYGPLNNTQTDITVSRHCLSGSLKSRKFWKQDALWDLWKRQIKRNHITNYAGSPEDCFKNNWPILVPQNSSAHVYATSEMNDCTAGGTLIHELSCFIGRCWWQAHADLSKYKVAI